MGKWADIASGGIEEPVGKWSNLAQVAKKQETPSDGMVQIEKDQPVPEWGRKNPNLYGMYGALKGVWEQAGKPTVETGMMAAGAIAGAPAGPVGMVAGAGLGYGVGKQLTGLVGEKISGTKAPKELPQRLVEAGKDIKAGAEMEMGGQIIGKAAPAVISAAGKPIKSAIAGITGTGRGAVETAIESPTASWHPLKTVNDFDRALRGKMTGEEVVENARVALKRMKDVREADYTKQLAEITKDSKPIDTNPIRERLLDLMKRYGVNVSVDETGKTIIDTSRSAVGRKGARDIKSIINTVSEWGTKEGDNTAVGLDTLKRQLDDFYSESSGARSFVTNLRNKVKNTISESVPQYKQMMENYSEATTLIKDIEADLMLRKQGMTGRITADKTLRRLITAMKSAKGEKYEIRGDLVKALGTQGNEDLMNQVAGYAMSELKPRGLAGSGPFLTGGAALAYLKPEFLPLIAASSPRVTGEFLRIWGKTLMAFHGTASPIGRTIMLATHKKGGAGGEF